MESVVIYKNVMAIYADIEIFMKLSIKNILNISIESQG